MKVPEHDRLYLVVQAGYAYFFASNLCYKCDYECNIIETRPIDFKYSLSGFDDSVEFPVYHHDFPQLFKTHQWNDEHYGVAGALVYRFRPFEVTQMAQIPMLQHRAVQNNRMAVAGGRLFVTNGTSIFSCTVDADRLELTMMEFKDFEEERMKLHSLNGHLVVRMPARPTMYQLGLENTLFVNYVDVDYDEIIDDCDDYLLLQNLPSTYVLIYNAPELRCSQVTVDYNILERLEPFRITSRGWRRPFDLSIFPPEVVLSLETPRRYLLAESLAGLDIPERDQQLILGQSALVGAIRGESDIDLTQFEMIQLFHYHARLQNEEQIVQLCRKYKPEELEYWRFAFMRQFKCFDALLGQQSKYSQQSFVETFFTRKESLELRFKPDPNIAIRALYTRPDMLFAHLKDTKLTQVQFKVVFKLLLTASDLALQFCTTRPEDCKEMADNYMSPLQFALMISTENGIKPQSELFKALHNMMPDARDLEGNTDLIVAVRAQFAPTSWLLHQAGQRNNEGLTALMYACKLGNLKAAHILAPLEAGIRSLSGLTALHLVEQEKEIYGLLSAEFEMYNGDIPPVHYLEGTPLFKDVCRQFPYQLDAKPTVSTTRRHTITNTALVWKAYNNNIVLNGATKKIPPKHLQRNTPKDSYFGTTYNLYEQLAGIATQQKPDLFGRGQNFYRDAAARVVAKYRHK